MDANVLKTAHRKDCSFLQKTFEALHVMACYNNLAKWLMMSNRLVIITITTLQRKAERGERAYTMQDQQWRIIFIIFLINRMHLLWWS